jgi:hypothetical protein
VTGVTDELDELIACDFANPEWPAIREFLCKYKSLHTALRDAKPALGWAVAVAKRGPLLTPNRDYALEETYEKRVATLSALMGEK